VLVPIAVFCLHALAFGSWIVDDAGISFAYARNWAAGDGLVAQRGLPPVEGFSNFLWVLLVTPLYALGLFQIPWTAKALAVVLVALAYFACYRALAAAPGGGRVAVAGLTLASLQTSFVVWSVSGLENPLTVVLVALLLFSVIDGLGGEPRPHLALSGGLIVAALAMTRPDGIVFAMAYPIGLVLGSAARSPWRLARPARALVWHLGGLLPALGAFVAFRWWYFGDVVPNTYYAKGGPTREVLSQLLWLQEPMIEKLLDLVQSVTGWRAKGWVMVALLGATAWLAGRRVLGRVHAALAILLITTATVYLLLPADWMGEYRFATPFFLFFYLVTASLLWSSVEVAVPGAPARPRVFWAGVLVLALITLAIALPRSAAFTRAPTVPLAAVAESYGHRYERLAAILGVATPSVLAPSIGGPLLFSRVRIYDLGMLTDRRIARTVGPASRQRNQKDFYDYLFEEARPTFIAVSVYYAWLARLDDDPRFRRDYAPIDERIDGWVVQHYGISLQSGVYVRRDVLGDRPDTLERLRQALPSRHTPR
jgi:hypothetical protein